MQPFVDTTTMNIHHTKHHQVGCGDVHAEMDLSVLDCVVATLVEVKILPFGFGFGRIWIWTQIGGMGMHVVLVSSDFKCHSCLVKMPIIHCMAWHR